jgi:hypothetical protein
MDKPITYLVYLAISIALTAWVARTLHRSGRPFLVDAFAGNEEIADSVNSLLVVGFYLVNIGYVALAMKTGLTIDGLSDAVELLASKVGRVLLVLGAMHFFNLFIFSRMRKASLLHQQPPPVVPSEYTQVRAAS